MNDPDSNPEVRALIKAEYATGGAPLLYPQMRKVAEKPASAQAAAPSSATPAPAPVLKKAAPAGPTWEQLLDQVRTCLPVAMSEWLNRATSLDVPLHRAAPYMDLVNRAQKVGMTPMVRFELDDLAPLKFAKAVLNMEPDTRTRAQLLKAAIEATRCTLALRDATLVPPLGKAGRMFKAHEADAMRDRNFASFDDAFSWLDRAETTGALAKREQTTPCTNKSFLVCPP